MEDVCCRTCKDAKSKLEAKIEIALAKAEAKAAAEAAKAATKKASEPTAKAPRAPPVVTTKAPPNSVVKALLAAKGKPKGPCIKTKGGGCCHFPFAYKNSVYTNCITTPGHAKPWCGLDEYAKKWGECVNAVNGNWGSWFPFTHCSRSCGTGIKIRTRACDNPPAANGGAPCPGSPQENRYCNTQRCSNDGNWGAWSSYGQCSKTCGMGLKTRTRKCNNPAPLAGGRKCAGTDKEDVACQKKPCPAVNKPASGGFPETQGSRPKQSVLGQPSPPGGAGSGTGANGRPSLKLPTPEELLRQQQA